MAVSYTHLDVYKRQVRHIPGSDLIFTRYIASGLRRKIIQDSLSESHLLDLRGYRPAFDQDVYKRQSLAYLLQSQKQAARIVSSQNGSLLFYLYSFSRFFLILSAIAIKLLAI